MRLEAFGVAVAQHEGHSQLRLTSCAVHRRVHTNGPRRLRKDYYGVGKI